MSVSVKLVGRIKLKQVFRQLDAGAYIALGKVLRDSSMAIEKGAKERCPVRKEKGHGGRLRASIRVYYFNNGMASRIGSDVEYAAFVEFGTGRRGAASAHPPLPPGYGHGPTPGAAAQPFLYPAFEQERPKFIAKVAAVTKGGFNVV